MNLTHGETVLHSPTQSAYFISASRWSLCWLRD